MRIDQLKPGMTVYDCHRERAGNVDISVEGTWEVTIVEVHDNHVVARWNGNAPRKYYNTHIRRWRAFPKEWQHSSIFGERSCYMCSGKESSGHRDQCEHPRAIAARKRATRSSAA